MLDFRIETFLSVCDTMNYTRAAERLRLTQPAVSQHIRHLEEEYGVKLFRYQGKKLLLTPEGELVRDAARTMQKDAQHLRELVQAKPERPGRIAFGATRTIGEFALPAQLAAYLNQNGDKELYMLVDNTQVLLEQLDSGSIDFALVEGNFPRNAYDSLLYSKERYIAVCAPEHPLPKKPVRLEELLGQRLILREPGSGTRGILERYLDAKNLTVEDFAVRAQVGNINAIKKLVASGCGITFLYEAAVREELASGKLREIQLEDVHIVHDFRFIWRKNSIFREEFLELFVNLGSGN